MIKALSFSILFSFLVACSSAVVIPTPNELGIWNPEVLKQNEGVILIPQWHLAPAVNTKDIAKELPQTKNQQAIYNELSQWVKDHYVQSVVVEGCEGDLSSHPDEKYNGWSLNDLNNEKKMDQAQTHVGLKLLAKFDHKVDIECGDNLNLIKENQLALSDVRAYLGYKLRIEQKDLTQASRDKFTESAREILGLPKTASVTLVKAKLNSELKKSINKYEELIQSRNDQFIEKVVSLKGRRVIVIGAIHVNDLKMKLDQKHIAYAVWTPVGLEADDTDFMSKLKGLLVY